MPRWLKKAVKKVVKTVRKVVHVVAEVAHRIAAIPDLLLSLIGIQPKKYLRVQIHILAEDEVPVRAVSDVQFWLNRTAQIYSGAMNIEIVAAQLRVGAIHVLKEKSIPRDVLTIKGDFATYMSDAGDWFDDHCTYTYTSAWNGIFDGLLMGDPVYCFVIKEISDADGVTYVGSHDYSILEADSDDTTMAHEFGHALWLAPMNQHSSDPQNLMSPAATGTKLTRWQVSVARNSRHVTYWRTDP